LIGSKNFLRSFALDWGNEPYINGVYSYTLPNGKWKREIAKRTIDNKMFCAGEAMNTKKNYGNVHGAIESAMEVLTQIYPRIP
jgi:monoamine oxidase